MALMVLVLASVSCTDRTLGGESGEDTDQPDPPDRVERPENGPWSVCEAQPDCAQVEFCVFPQDEAGFCTESCKGGSPADCPEAYAGNIDPSCVDVGGNNVVCVLECGGGRDCPVGMVCERVEFPDGPRSLCF